MFGASPPIANHIAAGLAASFLPVVLWELWRVTTRWEDVRGARSREEVDRRALGDKGRRFVLIYYLCVAVALVATLPFVD